MKKLGSAVVGVLLIASTVSAQTRDRLFTQPRVPAKEDLDRLSLVKAWHTYLPVDGKRDGIFSMQIHDKQLILLLRSGAVMSIDPESGATQWRTRVGVPYVPPAGFGANSKSVFVAKGVDIYALDRTKGSLLWDFALDKAPTAAPVADEERIFVPAGTNRLNAYTLPGPETPAPAPVTEKKIEEAAPQTIASQMTARLNASVLGSTHSPTSVSAVTATGKYVKSVGPLSSATQSRIGETTGPQPQYLWDYVTETRPETRVEQASIVTDEYLLQVGANGLFFVISKFEPRVFYHFQADAPVSAALGSHGEIAYIASEDFRVYALDIISGKILWRFPSGGPIRQPPRVTDDSVYVAAERAGLYRLERSTGNTLWVNRDAERFLAANQKFVYATDSHGNLLILDRARGTQMAIYAGVRDFVVPIGNELTDRIYLSSNDGLLLCLHDRDYPKPFIIKHVAEMKPSVAPATKPAADKTPPKPAAKPKGKDQDEMSK